MPKVGIFSQQVKRGCRRLSHYTQDVVVLSGHRPQRLRSDREGECAGLEYRKYCPRTIIKREFAAANTPQQNRISEREWASLWNMTRCFLAEEGFPRFLWQEAFRAAINLTNRVLSTPLGGKTHFSMWHGETSTSPKHLRTLGARVFVNLERYVKKLSMNAWEGRMVGYGCTWIRPCGLLHTGITKPHYLNIFLIVLGRNIAALISSLSNYYT